jgi:chromosomal replication initiation ATPase DnaA
MQEEQAYQARWCRVRDRLRSEVGNNAFENWLRHLELQEIAEGGLEVIVIAPSRALQHWVYTHHFDRLAEEWQAEVKRVSRILIKPPPGMDDDEFDDEFDNPMPDDPVHSSDVSPEHQEAWRRVLDRLKPEIGEEASKWLRQLELHQVKPLVRDVTVTLVASTDLIRDWVGDNYAELIFDIWRAEDARVGEIKLISPPPLMRSRIDQNDEMSVVSVTRGSRKNHGGRAPKFDWEALWFELIRIAQIDGFNSRRELRQRTLDWIATNWFDQPSESVLREKLSRLSDILNLPPN